MKDNEFVGLSKVNLSNFKSIKSSPKEIIDLLPLTILCGENSSGKSSVLHSILLQLQSLSLEKVSDSQFPLNGNLIKLNNFQSILHGLDSEENMEIGLEFNALWGNNMQWAPVFRKMNNIKFDLKLLPVSVDNTMNAFTELQISCGGGS